MLASMCSCSCGGWRRLCCGSAVVAPNQSFTLMDSTTSIACLQVLRYLSVCQIESAQQVAHPSPAWHRYQVAFGKSCVDLGWTIFFTPSGSPNWIGLKTCFLRHCGAHQAQEILGNDVKQNAKRWLEHDKNCEGQISTSVASVLPSQSAKLFWLQIDHRISVRWIGNACIAMSLWMRCNELEDLFGGSSTLLILLFRCFVFCVDSRKRMWLFRRDQQHLPGPGSGGTFFGWRSNWKSCVHIEIYGLQKLWLCTSRSLELVS